MAATATEQNDNFHCPRILCLHGGGTTGEIMRMQCRSFVRDLSPHFRLVFAEGPFFCAAHPAILPVYEAFGPYRRWMRWLSSHPEIDDSVLIDEIEYQLKTAMDDDDRAGGHGPWVGLLGFSQGAKLAASILYESQLRERELASLHNNTGEFIEGFAGGSWKFAVCLAGRAPLISLREKPDSDEPVERPAVISDPKAHDTWGELSEKLRLPTIHVHGLHDQGLHLHRDLVEKYCESHSATVLEWDGDHRIPIKMKDISPITKEIYRLAEEVQIPKN